MILSLTTQQCDGDGAALKKKSDSPDPGIITSPPSGILKMEKTIRD